MAEGFYEKAQTFNTAMIGVGYGGAFALLSYTHADMIQSDRAFVAGGLLISLTAFVFWILVRMVVDTMGWYSTTHATTGEPSRPSRPGTR